MLPAVSGVKGADRRNHHAQSDRDDEPPYPAITAATADGAAYAGDLSSGRPPATLGKARESTRRARRPQHESTARPPNSNHDVTV